jgi:hypothetical protein
MMISYHDTDGQNMYGSVSSKKGLSDGNVKVVQKFLFLKAWYGRGFSKRRGGRCDMGIHTSLICTNFWKGGM